ncbi:MAG: endonuclease/exonuclease/phosphatase family protein [Alphaproteobacteria bacterium]
MRIATFNVENLFDRPKLLNRESSAETSRLLKQLDRLQKELKKAEYDLELLNSLYAELREFVDIREDMGRLTNKRTRKIVARGAADWEGGIDLKRERFTEKQRKGTATAIRALEADILCTIEVEGRQAMTDFGVSLLSKKHRFEQNILIDSPRDPRGIDIGLQWKVGALGRVRSHAYAKAEQLGRLAWVFSRDCLDVALERGRAKPIYLLCNHFKSKMGGDSPASVARRTAQATFVAALARGFDLKNDYVVVLGDFNDTPDSGTLAPLLKMRDLHDVFDVAETDSADRYTYVFGSQRNQIDYILVSTALAKKLRGAFVERRGMSAVAEGRIAGATPFDGMTSWKNAASDHGAVVADFDI